MVEFTHTLEEKSYQTWGFFPKKMGMPLFSATFFSAARLCTTTNNNNVTSLVKRIGESSQRSGYCGFNCWSNCCCNIALGYSNCIK